MSHVTTMEDIGEKVDALRKLWIAAPKAKYFAVYGADAPPFDDELAKDAVRGKIDYFCGCMIKADFSQFEKGNTSIFAAYDFDNGQNAAKNALGW